MTRTPDLIDALVETAAPVRRLRPPTIRAGLWLAFAAIVLGLIAIAHGLRPDFSDRVRQLGCVPEANGCERLLKMNAR